MFRANSEADTAWSASCARSRGCGGGHNVDSAVRCTARRCRGFGSIRVEGNARLTGLNGVLLVVLVAVEGATILRIRQRARLVGVLLVGPVLLKCASTVYRFIRYYAAARAYRQKGPPQPMLAAALNTWRDLRGSPTDPARSRRRVRIALTALAVVASIPAATAIMPEAALWTKETVGFRDR